MKLPVIPHHTPAPPERLARRVPEQAKRLLDERPELRIPEQFRPFVARTTPAGPALHLDDLSLISKPQGEEAQAASLQDRARLRAGDGDFVLSVQDPPEGYETYCRDFLGLGAATWLRPRVPPGADPRRLASLVWRDEDLRRLLSEVVHAGEVEHIHPHMGCRGVWELALRLGEATGRTLPVVAPPPALAALVNDKIAFRDVVVGLLGSEAVPPGEPAANLALLAARVREFASLSPFVAVKVPDSAGGGGNIVLEAEPLRRLSLLGIRAQLDARLRAMGWSPGRELLVTAWESEVVGAPSSQLWIPPGAEGPPVVEGIFEQTLEGETWRFVGARPARLPAALAQEITDASHLVALLFQRLGYVGRCSFDFILVGRRLEEARPRFIECNGRWGGTSLPMTLMNRLFGDWKKQPFAVSRTSRRGLEDMPFEAVVAALDEDLFDVRRGSGRLVLYSPTRLETRGELHFVALASKWEEVLELAEKRVPRRVGWIHKQWRRRVRS